MRCLSRLSYSALLLKILGSLRKPFRNLVSSSILSYATAPRKLKECSWLRSNWRLISICWPLQISHLSHHYRITRRTQKARDNLRVIAQITEHKDNLRDWIRHKIYSEHNYGPILPTKTIKSAIRYKVMSSIRQRAITIAADMDMDMDRG